VLYYDLSAHTLDTRPISRVYGVPNLYRDISIEDINELEKGLSVLENHAAQLISDLHKVIDTGTFTAKRRDVDLLRKYLFVMHYRREFLSKSYFDEDHPDNGPMRDWLQNFKKEHDLKNSTELWLFSLRYYMDTPHPRICLDAEEMYKKYGRIRLAEMMTDRLDPGAYHYLAVAYDTQASQHFLCFWEAADDTEFILSHNSFGLWEGLVVGRASHFLNRFFVVSPRIAVILRSNLLRPEVVAKLPSSIALNSDFLDVKSALPIPTYANQTNKEDAEHLISPSNPPDADDDVFNFKITKLTKKQTQAFNSVILLSARSDGSITFSSKERTLGTVRAHCQSLLNSSDRPRYEPLIQQLSSCESQSFIPPTTIHVPSASVPVASPSVSVPAASVPAASVPAASVPSVPVPSASVPSASVPSASVPSTSVPSAPVPEQPSLEHDVELYETLLQIYTGEKTYRSDFDRAQAVYQLVKQSRNSCSTFAAEYRKATEGAIKRYLARTEFSDDTRPPAKFYRSLSEERSEKVFKAFTPFLESIGVPAPGPSTDVLDQLQYQVIVVAFIGWAAHDEEIFDSVKTNSPALAEALLLETSEDDALRDITSHLIRLAV
jgi:Protein of unknown function (DUF4238)